MFTRIAAPARHVIAVGSGKGGVGKSTVSLNLALALAETGRSVGLLDADFYGPNIPLMVGLKRDKWHGDWEMARRQGSAPREKIQPIEVHGLNLMSAGFIIAEDQPMILDGGTLAFLIRQLVADVAWGDLDYLIVDLPPGTGDTQQHLLRLVTLTGAILVVTPQDVAHLDAKKAVQMFRRRQVPILGAVENMAAMLCPHCGERIDVFAPASAERSIWAMDVERLGEIPLDPAMSLAGDRGMPLLLAYPASPQAEAFRRIANRLQAGFRGEEL